MRPKPAHSLRFMLFLLFSSIGLLGSGLILDRLNNTSTLDSRSQATGSATPTIAITHTPQNPVVGQTITVNLTVNTNGYETTGVEARNLTTTNTLGLTLPATLTHIEPTLTTAVNTISGGIINYMAILNNFNTPFTTTTAKTIAKFEFTPTQTGSISFTFDPTQTIINEYGGTGINLFTSLPATKTITVDPAGTNPTPTPTPTPTPASTPPSGGGPTPTPQAECIQPYPPQKLVARSGLNPGEINVNWVRPGGQAHFTVSFGTAPGKYQWGQPDIGNTRQFTIKYLEPGKRYYLVVGTVNDCGGSTNSVEVSAVARAATSGQATPPPAGGPSSKPQVIIEADEDEPLATATPSATPPPAGGPTEPPTADQTLFDRLKSSAVFMIVIGIIVGLLANRIFGRKKPPFPPRITPDNPTETVPHPLPPTAVE